MTIQAVRTLMRDDLLGVEQCLREHLHSHLPPFQEMTEHAAKHRGKQLRPLMALLTCRACDYQGTQHVTIAAMLEILHLASLLHDDVIDESATRRGQETANHIWGNRLSILLGDFFMGQYMQLLCTLPSSRAVHHMLALPKQLSLGEMQQYMHLKNPAVTLEAYWKVIDLKTATFFATATATAAALSETNESVEQELYQYGIHFGRAFQLIDDLLDYTADPKALGKNTGDDLADGLPTFPILHALKNATLAQKKIITHSIEVGDRSQFETIKTILHETRSIEHTQKMALEEIDKAITALSVLPHSIYKENLISLAHYAINRGY